MYSSFFYWHFILFSQFGGGKPTVVRAPTEQASEASVSPITIPPPVRPPPSHKQSMKDIQKASTVDIHVASERPTGQCVCCTGVLDGQLLIGDKVW